MRRARQLGVSLAWLALCAPLQAQDDDAEGADDEVIEEIVVTVNKDGDPVDVDAL